MSSLYNDPFSAVWKSPTCADYSECAAANWIINGILETKCANEWAKRACPLSCGACTLCALNGEWSDWSECSATCGTGGQLRTRAAGTCTESYTESKECNAGQGEGQGISEGCSTGQCTLIESSDPITVISEDNKIIENLKITVTGSAPAIGIHGSRNVTIRNVHIVHEGSAAACAGAVTGCSGPGIYFNASDEITIENVKVEMHRPVNPHANDGDCNTHMCGPFSDNMKYAFNIQGYNSGLATLRNVHVSGGSSGFWCKNCTDGTVSHFKAENVHGPYPRGQCLQVTNSDNFTLEDFYCFNDKRSFTEDTISFWESSNGTIRRGLIDGGNGPNGVGVMFERSHDCVCEDVDITNNRKGGFSAYGSDNVLFLRTRSQDNHGASRLCMEGSGYCVDPDGINHCCGGTHPDGNNQGCNSCTERMDCGGGVWYSGDYTDSVSGGAHNGHISSNVRIKQGIIHNVAQWHDSSPGDVSGSCIDVTGGSWEVAGAMRFESYIERDFTVAVEPLTVRQAIDPMFCWEPTRSPTNAPSSSPTNTPTNAPTLQCQSWCGKDTRSWSKKCGWSNSPCGGCSSCA